MSLRSSFLLLVFFTRRSFAVDCVPDDLIGYMRPLGAFNGCKRQSRRQTAGFCANEKCRNHLEKIASYEFPDCTGAKGPTAEEHFGPYVENMLDDYNTECGTNVSRGASSDTKVDESSDTKVDEASSTKVDEPTDAKVDEPTEAEVDESSDTKVDDASTTKVGDDSSGAPGYSAAHYMLAILVPMALLCL